MTALRFVLGDQLSRDVSALQDLDRARDIVLMVEVQDEATYVRHHKQKLVLVLAAMRHFAASLRAEGIHVDYVGGIPDLDIMISKILIYLTLEPLISTFGTLPTL